MRAGVTVAVALVVAVILFCAGWYVRGLKVNSDALLIERAATAGADKAGALVVGAIGKLRPRYTTITNEVHHASQLEPRYSDPACFHSDAVWLQLRAAYEAIGGPAPDRAGLPATATAAGGSQPAADHAGPD